jgi:hypothetical protein
MIKIITSWIKSKRNFSQLQEVHPRLQEDGFRFILVGSSDKYLKKPLEGEWSKIISYCYDDPKLLAHLTRGNYGICSGYGDLHILDCDNLTRWHELGIVELIPETFTVETRPTHRHFYLKCREHFRTGGLFDPDRTTLNHEGKNEYIHIGDIKGISKDGKRIWGADCYAIGPGCKHPSGSVYTVIVDMPIAEVSSDLLRSIISKFKTSRKANNNDKNILKGAMA